MNCRHMVRSRYAAIACLFLLVSVSCGGGGGGGVIVNPEVTFTADDPSPGSNTLSMQAGPSSVPDFDVVIRADGIANLFGVAFHVKYTPAVATFTGFTAGALLGNPGPPLFDVADLGGGELAVVKTLQGAVAGVPGTGVLLTLHFQGGVNATNSPFTFTPAGSRSVQVCPTAGGACTEAQGSTTWSGGKLTVVN